MKRASARAERALSGEGTALFVGIEDALDSDDVGRHPERRQITLLERGNEIVEGVHDRRFELVVDAFFGPVEPTAVLNPLEIRDCDAAGVGEDVG